MSHSRKSAGALLLVLAAATHSAGAQTPETVRPELGKPLVAAQELLKTGKHKEALAALREADAVANRTPYENFVLERMRGAAAAGAGDDATTMRSFEAVLAAGRLERAESLRIIEALAGTAYRAKDYGKAIEWTDRYHKEGGTSAQIASLRTSARFQMGDYAGIVRDMQERVRAVEQSVPLVDETTLRMLAASYAKLGDEAGYVATLEKLLLHHPNKDYWADMLARLPRQPNFADRLALDLLRLKLATGTLDTADETMELAQLALHAGLPAEAKRVVQSGYAAGVLGTGVDAARHKRLQELANKQATEDERAISSEVVGRTGDALFNTGMALASAGRTGKGLELMEQGLAKGGLKRPDDARLHYGQALLAIGQKARAIEAYKGVKAGEGLADLGRLWALHAAAAK
jgi:tetratricopeptide (TPR) repeat protein